MKKLNKKIIIFYSIQVIENSSELYERSDIVRTFVKLFTRRVLTFFFFF